MRISISIGCIFAALSVLAFDSAAWCEKRDLHLKEAERLRAEYGTCLKLIEQPAEDVTVPVEVHEDGSVKTVIIAKRAQYFLDRGLVWAEDVVVRKFKKDGSLETKIEAKNCLVDRYAKCGWAEGHAVVTHGSTIFNGKGVYFSSPDAYIKVFEDSDIVSKDLKFGGLRP